MSYLFLLFVLTPVVELYLLIKVGSYIGALNTILIVIFTGIAGAYLARSQGIRILNKINDDLSSGLIPAESLIDGLFVLIGGILLITPGIITDIIGFLLVIPATRAILKRYLKAKFKEMAQNRTVINVRYFNS